MKWTAKIYISAARKLTRKISQFMGHPVWDSKDAEPIPKKQSQRIWFHAASAGELESLWPVIQKATQERKEIWLTVFSPSGVSPLEKLAKELRDSGALLRYAGLSPREGDWSEGLDRADPDLFVTVKYEAWPELWMQLKERKIPLVILAARSRSALRWAKRICRGLGDGVPSLTLLTAEQVDRLALIDEFPSARVETLGDPRWDRVRARSLKEHLRAREIVEQARLLPRPWGIFGSAWQTDLEFWGKELQDLPGTLWIVPHHIDETTVGLMERLIQSLGMKVFRSTDQWHSVRSGAVNPKVILVNEMGFLSELYRHGDWAYVGGGHGKSLHSTIEPAIHGIAMAAGPQGASRFSEIEVLMETGQLRLLESNSDLLEWKMQMREQEWKRRDPHWLTAIEDRYGATERVWSVICQTLDGSLGN